MDTLFEPDAGRAPETDAAAGRGERRANSGAQPVSESSRAGSDSRPLAARVRPAQLQDFVGQSHLLGEGSALRTAIEQGHPHSMVLYGPPGTGKTTLARILAEHSQAVF